MLGAFLFRGDDVYKPLSVLSGGEKSRLAMLRMLLNPINLLVLDEPTNHLDLHSKDILLNCLKAYQGTIVFVSHDRGFMEALSTKTLELQAGIPRLFYGNYAYYLDRIERESAQTAAHSAAREKVPVLPPSVSSSTEHREQGKQRQTLIRRLERREAEILKEMEELEKEKARLEEELASPGVYSNGEMTRTVKLRLDECSAALQAKSLEWETMAEELSKCMI